MARNDFRLVTPIPADFTLPAVVSAGAASTIKGGEPTKQTTVGAVVIMATNNGTTSEKFSGIAKDDSSDTAAADGSVILWLPLPGILYSGKATSAAAVDTQAEIDALMGKRVQFDLTSSSWTVRTSQANATTNGVVIWGGNVAARRVHFFVSPQCTILDNPTTA